MNAAIPDTTLALIYATPLPDALASGALVAASPKDVREAGFTIPVFLTRAAWDRHVALTSAAVEMGCDETGRLWDVLCRLRWAALAERHDETSPLEFELLGVTTQPRVAHRCRLYAFFAGGAEGEPRIVIATAPETLGEEHGAHVDRYLALFGISDGDDDAEDENDDGDLFVSAEAP